MNFKRDDWGGIKLKQIKNECDFWSLYDEMLDDKSRFLYMRDSIMKNIKRGNLYGLQVDETLSMISRNAQNDPIFCKVNNSSKYLLPCFCVAKDNEAIILWTHTKARRNGFGKTLVELLEITKAYEPLPDAHNFWKSVGIFK